MRKVFKRYLWMVLVASFIMAGCSNSDDNNSSSNNTGTTQSEDSADSQSQVDFVPELSVSFGREGIPFTMNLYDNDTARAISRYVGTSDWNLPIYHYNDYENYEVMQYYDIPDRYDIPSSMETITSEEAGEVYYSEPNRIVLFYQDANITGEYTKLGYFDATDNFVSAVENNPVVEGWTNKIISIKPVE